MGAAGSVTVHLVATDSDGHEAQASPQSRSQSAASPLPESEPCMEKSEQRSRAAAQELPAAQRKRPQPALLPESRLSHNCHDFNCRGTTWLSAWFCQGRLVGQLAAQSFHSCLSGLTARSVTSHMRRRQQFALPAASSALRFGLQIEPQPYLQSTSRWRATGPSNRACSLKSCRTQRLRTLTWRTQTSTF